MKPGAYPSLPTGPPPPSSGPPPSAYYAPFGASPWGAAPPGSSGAAPGPMAASRPPAQQPSQPQQPQQQQQQQLPPQQLQWGPPPPPPPPLLGGAAAQQQQQPPMAVPFSNGQPLLGGGGLSSMGSDSVSLIRLRLDDFRIDPPIPLSWALVESAAGNGRPPGSGPDSNSYPDLQSLQLQQRPGGQGPGGGGGGGSASGLVGAGGSASMLPVPSLEVERALVAQGEGAGRPNPVADFFNKADPSVWQVPPSVVPFVDMGYQHLHAALGVAYSKEYKLSDGDVPDFASNLSELQSQGYPFSISVGALALKGNDLRAATELCLSLPAAR